MAVFSIQSDLKLITRIKNGYRTDPWCIGILEDLKQGMLDSKLNITLKHSLLFIGSRLVIPKYKNLREQLFQLAHDNLGHFGTTKSYANLQDDFYWPNMRKDLAQGYIPGGDTWSVSLLGMLWCCGQVMISSCDSTTCDSLTSNGHVTTGSRCPYTLLHLPTSKKGDVLIATGKVENR